jgi:hypothetical protein
MEIERDMPECDPRNMDIEELTYLMKSPTDKYGRELARREQQEIAEYELRADYLREANMGAI